MQARNLVVSTGAFWGLALVAVLGLDAGVGAVGGVAGIFALVSCCRIYYTLYQVWEPETEVSPWRMLLDPTVVGDRLTVFPHLLDVLRPRWIRHTLRETGWNVWLAGGPLLGLLVVDLVLMALVLSAPPHH